MMIDVEGVVLKVYRHFQASALPRENLTEFAEYAELEWQELIKHVPARWLRIDSQVFPALMSYFVSKESDYSNTLRYLLSLTGLEDEENLNYFEYSKTSLYLHFSANVSPLFENLICFCKNRTLRQLSYLEL